MRRSTTGVGHRQDDNDDGETGGIGRLLLAPVRFVVLAVAWVLSVLWVAFTALWDALTDDPDSPDGPASE